MTDTNKVSYDINFLSNTKLSSNLKARLLIIMVILVLFLCFIIPEALGKNTPIYPILGGVIGSINSLLVMIMFYGLPNVEKSQSALVLVFWRAFCDFGLGIRFVATSGFHKMVCDHVNCTNDLTSEKNCWLASGMTQFFQIASEAWFFCIGLDLFFSVTSPFSSFKSRLQYYHWFVWLVAIVLSLPAFVDESIYGYWYISQDNDAICWIQTNYGKDGNWKPWVMFYIPILLIYIVCSTILRYSFFCLRLGNPRTIVHRMKALISNSINIAVYLIYWSVIAIIYLVCLITVPYVKTDNKLTESGFNLLLFLIACKGFGPMIVWITIMNIDISSSGDSDSERDSESENNTEKINDDLRLDLNSALRKEVLYYATLGLRCSAREAVEVSYTQSLTNMKLDHIINEESMLTKKMTVFFFIQLVLGMKKQVQELNKIIRLTGKDYEAPNIARMSGKLRISLARPASANMNSLLNPNTINVNNAIRTLSPNELTEVSRTNSIEVEVQAGLGKGVELGNMSVINSQDNLTYLSNHFDAVGNLDDDEIYEINSDLIEQSLFGSIAHFFKSIFGLYSERHVVEFTEFEPYYFRKVRLNAGITDTEYINEFKTTIKERISDGGASGALFFFSKSEKFIAKSCTVEEVNNLKSIAALYATYLEMNGNSYISKIFGAYRLKIYTSSLYFFVMNNIFLNTENAVIHEKYDIKGSWVSRNASLPRDGQMETCTHCEQKFIFSRKKPKKKSRQLNSLEITEPNGSGSSPDNPVNKASHIELIKAIFSSALNRFSITSSNDDNQKLYNSKNDK